MSTPAVPARLHVLLARDAPVGVVIRRGPSKRVATIGWDRRDDTFTVGQWLHGRIYERRSDLSPDGRHLIYFAMDGRWQSDVGGSWSAVSRAPFLKAIALFPKGDCWNGGGLWIDDRRYWPNGFEGCLVREGGTTLSPASEHTPFGRCGNECLGVYFPRLLRDGWRQGKTVEHDESHASTRFDKALGHGWTLRKIAHSQIGAPPGKGCYWDEHALVHAASSRKIAQPLWEWADLDRGRLAWATGGRLCCGRFDADGLRDASELFDFNAMRFEPIVAPY